MRWLDRAIIFFSALLSAVLMVIPQSVAAVDFNSSNIISNSEFIDTNSMTAPEIQRFLEDRGGFLKDFTENGRSAAQIIYDASHGYGDASGAINGIALTTSTGTVSPKVILVTLQKEQSLLTMTSQNDSALRAAMGYACPDSGGCNSNYAGFTKQVENGAWQLRYNYERSQATGFGDYQVGQSFCFDDFNGTNCGTYENRATAALYRYTPHVYNGNYNFHNLYYNTYNFTGPEFAATLISWSSSAGLYQYPSVSSGQDATLQVTLRNMGRTTWQRGAVNLGTEQNRDRITGFNRGTGWRSGNRVSLVEVSVAPGENGTFNFVVSPPYSLQSGTYREHFRLVADGISWFGPELFWDISVTASYQASVSSWSTSSGSHTYPSVTRGGNGTNIILRVQNTGAAIWQRGTVNLGSDQPRDRGTGFLRESGTGVASGWVSQNRIQMQESSVPPGETATFSFWLQAPSNMRPGTYREHYRLVADGLDWFGPEYYWDFDFPLESKQIALIDDSPARKVQVGEETTHHSPLITHLLTFSESPDAVKLACALNLSEDAVEINQATQTAIISGEIPDLSKLAAVLPTLESVEADEPIRIFSTPNDPRYSSQATTFSQMNMQAGWDYVQGKTSAVIAVIDTGVDGTHEDLTGKVLAGRNISANTAIAANTDSDDNGHGTNIAGIAAAGGDNSIGMTGVDWQARILPIKAFNSDGLAETSDIVSAIEYAINQNATVITMSFGRSTPSDALEAAVNSAASRGILLVAAAGNTGESSVYYPAAYENVIAAGAVQADNARASFSNYGSALDLMAPGVSVIATADGGGYEAVSGTSFAVPFIAGISTLVKDFHSSASASDVTSILNSTATKVSGMNGNLRTDEYGNGVVNLADALVSAGDYQASTISWSTSNGLFTYPTLSLGGSGANVILTVRNTGTSRWFRDLVHLGADQPRDRGTGFLRESGTGVASGWVSQNRIQMQESSVPPGETATFWIRLVRTRVLLGFSGFIRTRWVWSKHLKLVNLGWTFYLSKCYSRWSWHEYRVTGPEYRHNDLDTRDCSSRRRSAARSRHGLFARVGHWSGFGLGLTESNPDAREFSRSG
ncbi:S8 family serine peptidase [Candidatus Berkelbacteria bacterium]|nr:S8 family serine peptidase [Candidatus Berkelbacteria bacterium]